MSPIKKSTQWVEYLGSLGRPLYDPLSKGSTRVGSNIWQRSNCGSLDSRPRTNKIRINMWKSDNLQNSTHLHIRQINSRVTNFRLSVNCHISLLRMLYLWRKLTVVDSWLETLRPQHCPCSSLKLRGWPPLPCGHWRRNWKPHISSTKQDPINKRTYTAVSKRVWRTELETLKGLEGSVARAFLGLSLVGLKSRSHQNKQQSKINEWIV